MFLFYIPFFRGFQERKLKQRQISILILFGSSGSAYDTPSLFEYNLFSKRILRLIFGIGSLKKFILFSVVFDLLSTRSTVSSVINQ